MPRLILFGVGQTCIVNKADNSISLIGCLHGLDITHEPGREDEPVPANAVVQFPWTAGMIWGMLPGDDTKNFEQSIEIILPDGRSVGRAISTFATPKPRYTLTVQGSTFPVAGPGEYVFRLSYRDQGSEDWEIVGEYPILVSFKSEVSEEQATTDG